MSSMEVKICHSCLLLLFYRCLNCCKRLVRGLTPCASWELWVRWRLMCWTVRRRAHARTEKLKKLKNDSLGGKGEPLVFWWRLCNFSGTNQWVDLIFNLFYFPSGLSAFLLNDWPDEGNPGCVGKKELDWKKNLCTYLYLNFWCDILH